MKKNLSMLIMALMIGVLLVAFVLTMISFGPAHPVPWIILAIMIMITIYSNRKEKSFYVTWKDEYSVGVKAIDDDHKQLLHLINQLQTAIHYQTGELFEKEALDAVVEYTKGHLAREEALMQKYGYPDFDAHKLEHEALIAKVGEFLAAYKERGHAALGEVADYLRDWLIHHINGTDMAYAPFFKEKGVS